MKNRIFALSFAFFFSGTLIWILLVEAFPLAVSISAEPLSPPTLKAVTPSENYFSATLETDVGATFDQPINPATANSANFVVHARQTGLITGSYNVDGENFNFTPSFPFKPGELIQASITSDTQNLAGENITSSIVWQFWTESLGGSGTYTKSEQIFDVDWIRSVSLGDLNKDGHLDIFFSVADGDSFFDPNEVWLNNGSGQFTDTGQQLGNEQTYSILGDLDHDGDLDAYVGVHPNGDQIWINDGNGVFSDSGQSLGTWGTQQLDLGDLDGNGSLDAFVVYWGVNPSKVWLNDGSGTFSDTNQLIGTSFSSVKLGDLDGDNDLDAFLGETGGHVWFNNGDGIFIDSGQILGSKYVQNIALGDLDSDGDLDAFLCNNIDLGNQVWLNDGTGHFTDTGQLLGNSVTFAVDLGDLDHDGDLDAIVVNNNFEVTDPDQIWLNDGSGQFSTGQSIGIGNNEKWSVDLGDLDGDGDLDAVFGTVYDQAEVWFNQDIVPSGLIATNNSPTNLGIETTFTATVSGGTSVQYDWNFGDGTIANGPIVSHMYPSEGFYTAVVTASNSTGMISATTPVTVTPPIPILDLKAFNSSPTVLNKITFITATISAGSNVTYTWDLGDSTTLFGSSVSHVYATEGVFTATVSANNGVNSAQVTTLITITKPIKNLYLPLVTDQ